MKPLRSVEWEKERSGYSYGDEGKAKITEWNIQEMAELLDKMVEQINILQNEVIELKEARS